MKNEKPSQLWAADLMNTPVGPITVVVSDKGLVQVNFATLAQISPTLADRLQTSSPAPAYLAQALQQIDEYLMGKRREFTLPIDERGWPPFDTRARHACQNIPYGQTTTYGEMARLLNSPGAGRAVGSAMAHNPLPLVIPCHRVLGINGKLHGYAAPDGVKTKAWLLELEQTH